MALLQLYSLGVPHPDSGVLAVHVVASDTEMDQVDDHKAMDEDACRRVAEALMFATAMNHLKTTNQVYFHLQLFCMLDAFFAHPNNLCGCTAYIVYAQIACHQLHAP